MAAEPCSSSGVHGPTTHTHSPSAEQLRWPLESQGGQGQGSEGQGGLWSGCEGQETTWPAPHLHPLLSPWGAAAAVQPSLGHTAPAPLAQQQQPSPHYSPIPPHGPPWSYPPPPLLQPPGRVTATACEEAAGSSSSSSLRPGPGPHEAPGVGVGPEPELWEMEALLGHFQGLRAQVEECERRIEDATGRHGRPYACMVGRHGRPYACMVGHMRAW